MPFKARLRRLHFLALLGYGALAALYLHPILRLARDHVLDNGDVLFNLSVVTWVADRVPHALAGVWDAPWFFPTPHALALSDHLIGPGILVALLRPLLGGEIPAFNLLFFLCFALGGWTAYLLFRRLGLSPPAAFVGGAIWTFLPFRWEQSNHIQILAAALVPVLLLAFHDLLAAPSWRRAAGFAVAYALHVSGGTYLAFMAHVPLAALLALALPGLWRRRAERRVWGGLATTAAACVTFTGALLWPYRTVAGLGLVRREQDWSTWGATAASFLQPSVSNWYGPLFPEALRRPENSLFPGFVALLLVVVGILARSRGAAPGAGGRRAPRALLLGAGAALLGVGVLLGDLRTWLGVDRVQALGGTIGIRDYRRPALLVLAGLALLLAGNWRRLAHARARAPLWVDLLAASGVALLLAFPALYVQAATALPGFVGMRVPARFFVFASLGLAAVAAYGFDSLRRRFASLPWARALPPLLLLLLLVESAPRPLAWQRLVRRDAQPEPATWLREHPEVHALLYLPLPSSDMPELEASRMWSALAHGRPIANGYSGQFPPSYRDLQRSLYFQPSAGELARLAERGISHLLLEWSAVRPGQRSALYHALVALESAGVLRVVFEGDGVIVYALTAHAERG